MTQTNRTITIESREHLLSTLAEAAELEHNLLCLYLYAVFSFKRSMEEGLTGEEFEAVEQWRTTILHICRQEMAHLALVAYLTTALGGGAHFFRPEFPVRPGYFPADFVLELAPFDQMTLQHFIFLERLEDEPSEDSQAFTPASDYVHETPPGRLMAYPGEYATVGQLYAAIEHGIEWLYANAGEQHLSCGAPSLQLTPEDVALEGLTVVRDKASAVRAPKTIVEQGEGARTHAGSHFETLRQIADEYDARLRQNPNFQPGRPVARNPVMRKPAVPEGKLWVNDARAAPYMDVANAFYGLILRFLGQVYAMEDRKAAARKTLLEAAFTLMQAVSTMAGLLSQLPASPDHSGVNAGISFALNRYVSPLERSSEQRVLVERIDDIRSVVESLQATEAARQSRGSDAERAVVAGLVSVETVL